MHSLRGHTDDPPTPPHYRVCFSPHDLAFRVIHNTDGHWIINYQDRRDPNDIVRLIPVLAEAGVDALSVLAGIDDDISWRGSPHAQLFGDHITEWQPDPVPPGHPRRSIKEVGGASRPTPTRSCTCSSAK